MKTYNKDGRSVSMLRSNNAHYRIYEKYVKKPHTKENLIKSSYHADVVGLQLRENRVLTKVEKQEVYKNTENMYSR